MLVRPATLEDRPAIIELLRRSLGESSIPKSEALWLWKHEQNPFGPSYILLAEEDDTLIGLRAFMQWDWIRNDKIYKAVRAVDTATHPEYQGKGIFRKLTLQQVDTCRQEGVLFIFNTPNEQSRPGYLKMGWEMQGKMPLKIKILRPFTIAKSRLTYKEKYGWQKEDPSPFQKWTKEILQLTDNYIQKTNKLATVLTSQFISWRYANNPLFRYNYFTDYKSFLLISRIKVHSYTKELRLVDFVLLDPSVSSRYINEAIQKLVGPFCRQHQVDLISLSGQQFRAHKACFRWMGWLPVKPLGPIITLKDLNMQENFKYLMDTRNWSYSTGDLELF